MDGDAVAKLTIDEDGKVGINSTSPTYALEVDGGTQNTVIVARSSDAKAAISFLDNTTGGYGRATIGGEGSEVYITSGTSGAERLRISSGGLLTVKPGDTSSSYATTDGGIDIAQTISSTGTSSSQSIGLAFSLNKSGETGAISEIGAIRTGSGESGLVFRTRDNSTGRNERLRIRSDGKVVIGTNYTGGTLSVTGNLITDDGTNGRVTIQADGTSTNQILSTTTGFGSYCNMKYQAADHIFLYGGTERFRLKNDGRVVLNNAAVGSNEYLTLGPNGSTPCDMAFRLNNDNDARIKFYDGGSSLRGVFGYTTYANNSDYPNFHDSFYLQTDPSSNGTLATALRISNSGQFLKPLTYQFLVETNGQSVSGGWTKLTGLTPDSCLLYTSPSPRDRG
mgnify:CR=1 FL=1